MKNKGGLSDVVTTVLIILLAVAAVSALWVLIKPLITSSTNSVEKSLVCQSSVGEIASCTAGKNSAGVIGNHTIVYKLSTVDKSQVKNISRVSIGVIYADGSVNNTAGSLNINSVGELNSVIISTTTPKSASKATLAIEYTMNNDQTQTCAAAELACTN